MVRLVDSDHPPFLATVSYLNDLIERGSPVVCIDCRSSEDPTTSRIPGARIIPHDYWLKSPESNGDPRGTHIASIETLEPLFGALGVTREVPVVLYDNNQGRASCRAWWVLRYLGHANALVLDGGWTAWVHAGLSVESGPAKVESSNFDASPETRRLATIEDVREALESGAFQLVDTRSDLEWTGEDSHGNLRGGHIPNAVHLEWMRLLGGGTIDWHFLKAEDIRREIESVGIDILRPIITYCQGGVRAAHIAFGLEMVGATDVRVYDGSMAEWANLPNTLLESDS